MVSSRGRPDANQWEAIRAKFEEMYLGQNLTLNTIKEYFAQHGFVATDRQYKTKVKAWQLDQKKIKAPTWQSMFLVMRARNLQGLSSVFCVPIRGGYIELVRPDRIIKQIARDRTDFDRDNLGRAQEILRMLGVTIFTDDEAAQYEHARATAWADTPQALHQGPYALHAASSVFDDQVSSVSTDSLSPPSNHGMAVGLPINQAADTIYPTTSGDRPESISAAVPTTQTYLSPTAVCEIYHRPRTSYTASNPMPPPTPTAHTMSSMNAIEILFFDQSCNNSHNPEVMYCKQPSRNKTLNELGLIDSERSLAVQWAAPYLEAFLRRRDPNVRGLSLNDRENAKDIFRTMLKRSNRYIFPYSNWMVTVLASYGQTVLLTEFLHDCCEVIDYDDKAFKNFYGCSLHITLALYTQNQAHVEQYRRDFFASIQGIRMIWSENSENYLVNQCYLAWLMLEEEQIDGALRILLQSLPQTELLVGRQHVVTLNCLSILARALGKAKRVGEAIAVLQDVTKRLEDCVEVLQAYRYRQIIRLAELQDENGDVGLAEVNFRAVAEFRVYAIGLESNLTWQAIRSLVEFLSKQGRQEESLGLLRQLREQHDPHVVDRWSREYNLPVL